MGKELPRINEFKTYKCACCGEEHICLYFSQYAWKFKGRYCCSYHCMRELEKEAEKKRGINRVLSDK